MKTLIVSAIEQEILSLSNVNIDTLITGIGIPNSIYSLTDHLNKNEYNLIVNIGICGSFKKDYRVGDVVEIVTDRFSEIGYENNNDFQTFGDSFKIKTFFKSQKKTLLRSASGITVNMVHGNEESIRLIINNFNPDIESMEGAACMMVAEKFNIPFVQIRAISNYVEKRNKDNWNIDLAIKNLHSKLEKILPEL